MESVMKLREKRGVYNRHKNILGIGINDSDYVTQTYVTVDGKRQRDWTCPYFEKWYDVLKRVTGRVNPKSINNSYKDVILCDEWLLFSNFKRWMEQQDWQGKFLDKDILSQGVKIYSPDTCCFVSRDLNNFFVDRAFDRGSCAIGVSHLSLRNLKRPYKADISIRGKRERLGYYTTPEEAHKQWQIAKHAYGVELMNEQADKEKY